MTYKLGLLLGAAIVVALYMALSVGVVAGSFLGRYESKADLAKCREQERTWRELAGDYEQENRELERQLEGK